MSDQLSADLASLRIDRATPPSQGMPWWAWSILVIGTLAGGSYVAWQRFAPSVFKTEVATTEVIQVLPSQAATELTGVGYVVAQRQSKVACQILSRISEMLVNEGQRVKTGDVLFRVEDAAQKAALSAARARASAARARINAATATLAQLRQQLVREKNLFQHEASPRATSDDLQEQVNSQDAVFKAAVRDAEAADEDVHAAEVQLDYTTVRAPFDGIVLGKPLNIGELVGTVTEKPAVELCDPETLLAEIDVPERRIEKCKLKGPAEVILEAYPDVRYRSEIVEIGSRVDRSKGTVTVKLKMLDVPPRLLPDMRARANFLTEAVDEKTAKAPPKTVVPKSAVVERGGARWVFQLDDGRVRQVPIETGEAVGTGYELRKGPAVGTVLVADPPETMADGQPVKEKTR